MQQPRYNPDNPVPYGRVPILADDASLRRLIISRTKRMLDFAQRHKLNDKGLWDPEENFDAKARAFAKDMVKESLLESLGSSIGYEYSSHTYALARLTALVLQDYGEEGEVVARYIQDLLQPDVLVTLPEWRTAFDEKSNREKNTWDEQALAQEILDIFVEKLERLREELVPKQPTFRLFDPNSTSRREAVQHSGE